MNVIQPTTFLMYVATRSRNNLRIRVRAYRAVQVQLLGREGVHKRADGFQVTLGSADVEDPLTMLVADAQSCSANQEPLDDGNMAPCRSPHQGGPAVDVRPEDALSHDKQALQHLQVPRTCTHRQC